MKKSLVLGSFLFAILALVLMYMAGFFADKVSPEPLIDKRVNLKGLTIHTMQSELIPITRTFSGSVVADQRVILSARLTARIGEILVDIGDSVKKGDVLVRLDSGDLTAKVKQTQQAVSSAQAQLNIARKEVNRLRPLYKQKLISPSQYDQAESQLKTSKANFEQAKAAVSEAETTFGFSIITAPFDAVIEQRVVDQGDLATPGMHLLTLYNPQSLQLETNVSESLINKLSLGSQLNYQLSDEKQQKVGQIVKITPASSSSSRSVLVNIVLQEDASLFPGRFGKVWVNVAEELRLILPLQAVYKVGQLDYVNILEEGRVTRRLVQLGEAGLVRKGLKAGDKVIIPK